MRILLYPALGERQVDELMPGIGVCLHSICAHDYYRNNSDRTLLFGISGTHGF